VEEVMVVGDKDGKERTLAGRRKLARFSGIITVIFFTLFLADCHHPTALCGHNGLKHIR
jgi:hypothetical protein